MWASTRFRGLTVYEGFDVKTRDQRGVLATVVTDLSKAFDCIPHDLLIAKLVAFGFDRKSLAFILAYLKNRKQKTNIGSAFSDFLNILYGVSQRSILGRRLFIIFIADLIYINNNFDYAIYAGDKTSYACRLMIPYAEICFCIYYLLQLVSLLAYGL